jgi:DNA invertase Pin-like site-specific DNA recombinase
MKVGYACTSSIDQLAGFEAQLEELRAVGCEKIFHEQISSIVKRPQLQAGLVKIR